MVSFIQQLDFECIVLIDEAEKTFKRGESDEVLLKLIDGVYNRSRKLYILTTNTLNVNENYLDVLEELDISNNSEICQKKQ